MIVNVILEEEDFDVLHDVILSASGVKCTSEQLQLIWDNLPEDIKGTAISWGSNDTVFRDNLHEYIAKEVKEAEELYNKQNK